MTYGEFAPAPALRNAIASYWRFALQPSPRSAPHLHTVPPDGAVNLCWLPPGRAVVVGPRVTALRVPVQPGMEYMGVRFLPGAAAAFLGLRVPSIRDKVEPIERSDFALAMQTSGLAGLDDLLTRWAQQIGWQGPDPAVGELTLRILQSDGMAPVGALVAGLNLSYRQILRRFHESAGLTPKEFARLRRLRLACLQAVQSAEPRWAGLSADTGYSDQSHLVREFQDIYGWPPRLVHEYLRRIEHGNVIG